MCQMVHRCWYFLMKVVKNAPEEVQTDTQTVIILYLHVCGQLSCDTETMTRESMAIQPDRRTDKQTEGWTDGQTHRQTHRQLHYTSMFVGSYPVILTR